MFNTNSISILLTFSLIYTLSSAQEPNPPQWGSSVYVFDPADSANTQAIVDKAFAVNGGHQPPFHGQFSEERFAFLFKQGVHDVDVSVGFYTSVIGLGKRPHDTHIRSVTSENGDFDYTGGALSSFWRSAENFYTRPTKQWNGNMLGMLWAVSQACPLRRIVVEGDLLLWQYNSGCCAGWASGGYMSDSVVTGMISSGPQQQWISRNVEFSHWDGGVWNLVLVGAKGNAPQTSCPSGDPLPCAYSNIHHSPVIAEKPYLYMEEGTGKFYLMVPPVEYNKQGASNFGNNDKQIDFQNVFVAKPGDNSSLINSKLDSGLHLVLSPGIYHLESSIVVRNSETVVLGIGFPTLICGNGQPCIHVENNLNGVRVSSILLDAGKQNSPSLIRWGSNNGEHTNNPQNPSFLYDLFARVGGPNDPREYQVSATNMIEVNSPFVVIDNTWLWRADHDITGLVRNGDNPVLNGLLVNPSANNLTVYGLASEHTLNDLVSWNAENGQTYFYQSEFPYDVTHEYGTKGYTSYKVASHIQHHRAHGIGAYSFFRDYDVIVNNGIETGTGINIWIENPFTVFLNGQGGITHVINDKGNSVHNQNQRSVQCDQ